MIQYYLKLSFLSIKRTPMLTALMVIAIGLGIGVSMTVLTIHYLMGKDPIPSKSDQLFHVQLYTYSQANKGNDTVDGFPGQLTYQDTTNIKRSTIPVRNTRSLHTGFTVIPEAVEQTPFMESARAIDSDFFAMFKLSFIYGASWDKSVDQSSENVAVIAKELNERLFKGENSVGKQINLNSILYTIVGVTDVWQPAPRYYDLNNGIFRDSELLFVPFSLAPVHEYRSWGNNNSWKREVISTYQEKLKSETFWTQHWVELKDDNQKQLYQNWLTGYISEQKKLGRFDSDKAASSLKDVKRWMDYNEVVSNDNSILVWVSFMFLAVCLINTIGLLLAKFLQRSPEVGVRRALGASKTEIFIQHIVDVGLIGFSGGMLGLAIGKIGLMGVKSLYSSYSQIVHMDLTLILIAIAISMGSSILAGLYPAWLICRTSPSVYLKVQ